METAFPPCHPVCADWKVLYRAAIYEIDRSIGSQKITDAENAVLARGRELFYAEGTFEEQEELEDALYALRALRSAWQHARAA